MSRCLRQLNFKGFEFMVSCLELRFSTLTFEASCFKFRFKGSE